MMVFFGMMSAPETFMAIANATAAIVRRAPPYVTYRVRGAVRFANSEGTVDRIVSVRTEDGSAVVRDNKTGKDVLRPPFPAPPNFDALSAFQGRIDYNYNLTGRVDPNIDMRVSNIEPLHYTTIESHADAVAKSVAGYFIAYADDATPQQGHLHLEPSAQKRREGGWLSDVWYDPQTMIPTRVLYGGPLSFLLDARYATMNGVWLLSSITVSAEARRPWPMGRSVLTFRGDYDEYEFPTSPPDARLAPLPTSTPISAPA